MSSSTLSQKAHLSQMSLLEKLSILPILAYSLASGLATAIRGVFVAADRKPPSFYRHFMTAVIQGTVSYFTPRQMQFALPPTDKVYEKLCKKHGMIPKSEVLEDGTRAHWIGPSSASKIIINFHGGGYVIPAQPQLFEFTYQIYKSLSQADPNQDIAILFLSYDLAPSAPYPRQLQQAVLLLHHVLNTLHKRPENIILTGNSAGGNLALALLSHISHPHPSCTPSIPPLHLSAPFRAYVLLSPWLDFSTTKPSVTSNAAKDIVNATAGNRWSSAFMGAADSDFYNQAILAPDAWWEGIMVRDFLILAGRDEILVDGIVEFAERLKGVRGLEGRVAVLVAEGEVHDAPNTDILMGFGEVGKQGSLMMSWIGSKL